MTEFIPAFMEDHHIALVNRPIHISAMLCFSHSPENFEDSNIL